MAIDFKDTIVQLSERISKLKDNIATEEATKNAFILPMLQALGYDVFNPLEVVPEFTCDIGTKKGEKIDFAIQKEGKTIMLIEAKHWRQDLTLLDNQLLRYFHVSDARFGILTNGIIYRFYTDIDKNNVMDEKHFLEVDMENLSDAEIEQLKKFHKSYFSENEILSTANELKLTIAIKNIVKREFLNPGDDFTKFFVKEINDGKYSAKLIETYAPILKKCIQSYINDVISERLNTAIESGKENAENKDKKQELIEIPENAVEVSEDGKIVTTKEEIDAFIIVKNILRQKIDVSRISYKDFQTYFAIRIDDSQWKWIIRLSISKTGIIKIGFPTEDYKNNEWFTIEKLDDIYNYSDRIIRTLEIALNM
jgi:hypothetical protein